MNYEPFNEKLGSCLAKFVILVDVLYALNARVKSDSGKKKKNSANRRKTRDGKTEDLKMVYRDLLSQGKVICFRMSLFD